MINCKTRTKIDISPSFVAFLCVYYYLNPANTFFSFVFSVFLHELGHMIVLWLFRAKIHTLRLTAFGAAIVTEPLGYKRELVAALGGPAMNLLLLVAAANRAPMTTLVNLCLFSYNLLPIYPLDGGRILRSALLLCLPVRVAGVTERFIGALCSCTLLFFAIYLTCVCQVGLWPLLALAIISLRTSEVISPKRRKKVL